MTLLHAHPLFTVQQVSSNDGLALFANMLLLAHILLRKKSTLHANCMPIACQHWCHMLTFGIINVIFTERHVSFVLAAVRVQSAAPGAPEEADGSSSGADAPSPSGGSGPIQPAGNAYASDATELLDRYINFQIASCKFLAGSIEFLVVSMLSLAQPDIFSAFDGVDSKVCAGVALVAVLYTLAYARAQDTSSAYFKYDRFRNYCINKWGDVMARDVISTVVKDHMT